MRGIGGLWLVVCLSISSFAQAGDLLPSRQQVDGWLKGLGSDNQFNPDKGIDWGVMPGPFYTPELGLGVGMAIVGMYRPDKNDHVSQNSTLSLSGFASSTGAFGLGLENYSFLLTTHGVFISAAHSTICRPTIGGRDLALAATMTINRNTPRRNSALSPICSTELHRTPI